MRKSTKHKVLTCDFNCDSSHHATRAREASSINRENHPPPTTDHLSAKEPLLMPLIILAVKTMIIMAAVANGGAKEMSI